MIRPPEFCPWCRSSLVPRPTDGLERLSCSAPDCEFVHWDNPTPVVAAVVEHEGRIVLAQNRAWPVKFFGLITGFLERHEDPAEAVLREVEEELSLQGRDPQFIGHYPFQRMNQLIIAYHVPAVGDIRLGEELVDHRSYAPTEIKAWPQATGLALRDWLRRAHDIDPPMLDISLRRKD